jgi:hypothetical protein
LPDFWTAYNGSKTTNNRHFTQFFRVQKSGKKILSQSGIFRHPTLELTKPVEDFLEAFTDSDVNSAANALMKMAGGRC